MEFDQDAIVRLAPETRIEVQDLYLLRDTKKRDFRDSGQRDRRRIPDSKIRNWPHTQPWTVNQQPAALRGVIFRGPIRSS